MNLPHNIDFEKRCLGIFLTIPAKQDFIAHINEDFFYNNLNKDIFKTIKSMYEAETVIELTTVCTVLPEHKYEIVMIANAVSSDVNLEYYLRLLEQMMRQRKFLEYCYKVSHNPEYINMDFGDMVDENNEVMADIMDLKNWRVGEMEDVTDKALESLKVKGIENGSGWYKLDKIIGGLKKQDLILIAGRPGMGKTALGLCLAIAHEVNSGGKPAFISLEMPKDAIAKRRLSIISGYEAARIINKDLTDFDIDQIGVSIVRNPTNMLIDDTPGLDLFALGAKIKQMVRHDKITAVFVDYIQLIKPMNTTKTMNKEQEIGRISTGLKLMARQLNIPIVAMAQVNREGEKRGDKRPQLSELRDSGQLEQDADIVLFPYRPTYYAKIDIEGSDFSSQENCELIIAKNRNGRTGKLGGEDSNAFIFNPLTIQYIFG